MISPLVVALFVIAGCSLFREPDRHYFSTILIAGAGAAYLNGGLGIWEFVFCITITGITYFGLRRYWCIGVAWVMHTIWDVVHHAYGTPIVPFLPDSSIGCAICDVGLAAWYFAGAPSIYARLGRPIA
jgi:Na+/proline symporter